MRLGTAGNLSAVPEAFHDLARLASAVRALQPALSTTGLPADRRRLLRRSSRTALQRSGTLARFIHLAPMGTTAADQLVVLDPARTPRPALSADPPYPCL